MKCDTCKMKRACNELERMGKVPKHENCRCYSPKKPITNYDRIISKTPEELAEWIETIADCDSCQYSWSLGKCLGGDGTSRGACRLKWLNWLKAEADNGEN